MRIRHPDGQVFTFDACALCGADNCALIYLDTSRPGNRRWCSMERCGNRAKVRGHRSRSAIQE